MKGNLTIIVPTLNNVNGLKYLLNHFKDKPYEVVVVDNKKKNLGFAGGVNKGAENVETKWMLILNDDIEFKEEKYSLDSRRSPGRQALRYQSRFSYLYFCFLIAKTNLMFHIPD